MQCLIFSSDGTLRVKMNEKNPSLPLFFLKEQSAVSDVRFMSRWLATKVMFEHGLTIGTFLKCLEPFQEYLNDYLDKDISSYITESKKLLSIEQRISFDWVTLFHQYTVSEQNEYIKKNNTLNIFRPETNERLLNNKWKMYDNYMVCAYHYDDNEHYSVEKYPIHKIQHIPLFLDKQSRIIINQKDIQRKDERQSLLNPNAFGVMKQVFDDDYNIDYLLIDKEHTFNDVIEGFFKFFNKDIHARELENEMLEDLYNQEKQDDSSSDSAVKFKIHGGCLNQLMNEMEEKNQAWDNLVLLASSEGKIVKIGKVEEGVLPEKKLFGQSIREEIKKN